MRPKYVVNPYINFGLIKPNKPNWFRQWFRAYIGLSIALYRDIKEFLWFFGFK